MSMVDFFCAICGTAMTAQSTSDRRLTECPRCAHVVPIPTAVNAAPELSDPLGVLPPGVLALEIKFRCRSCGCKMQTDARWEGHSVDCAKCKRRVEIPYWSRKAPGRGQLSAAEIEFLTGELELETQASCERAVVHEPH
jgi:DNA-directed RNA polymerase subunit M/transcription elongation factor TFIIS